MPYKLKINDEWNVHFFLCLLFHISDYFFTEIEARPNMESDKKLDKLESFLGRLNSKGVSLSADSQLCIHPFSITAVAVRQQC